MPLKYKKCPAGQHEKCLGRDTDKSKLCQYHYNKNYMRVPKNRSAAYSRRRAWCKTDIGINYMKKYCRTPESKFTAYRNGASERNISFDLTMEQFKSFWNGSCFYCGHRVNLIGLDRVDNSIGYSVSNIVSCCSECNRMKGIYSQKDFIDRCTRIAKNFVAR